MRRVWQTVTEPLLQCIFPPTCLHCAEPLFGYSSAVLCENCCGEILLHDNTACHFCGSSAGAYATLGKNCEKCRNRELVFTRATAVCVYKTATRDLIHAFKFHQNRKLAVPLAAMMLTRLATSGFPVKIDCVMPVPLHPRRQRERGYNQSLLLAEQIAAQRSLPLDTTHLRRIRYTQAQALLSAAEREHNPRGAFAVSNPLPEAAVLLIDDVLTTGATVSECARVLREAGASRVYVLVFSR